mmetsp:Transcript_10432/g.33011  ORF Transcript_10432/g.33011 Transcript_10432/m.33011 type:complete len:263 (-) Transcript_10432:1369-2157(-)
MSCQRSRLVGHATVGHQQADDVEVRSPACRVVQRQVGPVVARRCVCACLQQHAHRVQPPLDGREVQRRPPIVRRRVELGTGTAEQLHDGRVSPIRCQVQRAPAARGRRFDVRAGVQQRGHNVCVRIVRGKVQGWLHVASCVGVSAGRQEQANDGQGALRGREVERRPPFVRRGCNVGTRVDEQANSVGTADKGRVVQGGTSVGTRRLDVRAGLQQHLDDARVSLLCRVNEGGRRVVGAQVGVGTAGEEQRHNALVPLLRRIV